MKLSIGILNCPFFEFIGLAANGAGIGLSMYYSYSECEWEMTRSFGVRAVLLGVEQYPISSEIK